VVLADGPHGACMMPQTQCDADETAQVVVDGQGNVIDVVCLPPVAPGGFQNVVDGGVPQNANNTVITGCEIWGSVSVSGNNTALHGNRIGGYSFEDKNHDGVIQSSEVGEPIAC
jgi:hypothetical protein